MLFLHWRKKIFISSSINQISSTSCFHPKFHQLCFLLFMLYEAQTDARERQTKEVREKRKRQASWWDYVFMIVLRPISEMGAVPRIFSRPPSMACPRLVKSGSCWMDTPNWKAADLQQSFSTIVQPYWVCCSMGAFVFTRCASLMSVFPGGEGCGVYSHVGINHAAVHL